MPHKKSSAKFHVQIRYSFRDYSTETACLPFLSIMKWLCIPSFLGQLVALFVIRSYCMMTRLGLLKVVVLAVSPTTLKRGLWFSCGLTNAQRSYTRGL